VNVAGLEGLCSGRDWLRSRRIGDGVEVLQAWFGGRGFSRHRHDTYGICVTDSGVQTFDYRGRVEHGLFGQVTVLHPDEPHDGRAGDDAGFGYRIVYVAPALIASAVSALAGRAMALPFVPEPVGQRPRLARAVERAFASDEPLAVDALVLDLASGLLAAQPRAAQRAVALNEDAVARAREYLTAELRVVHSAELEAITGLSRYDLARQFRQAYGTSPYRYSLLRRLDAARERLLLGTPPAVVAQTTGFADQAHLTRHFRAAFGQSPAHYAGLFSS
jgi:AraC-like DNA-binding protein